MTDKASLRLAVKERLARMTENDRRVESQVIVRELLKLLANAKLISVYIPYADEPNIAPLITELLTQKKVICLPKAGVHGMKMYQIKSLEEVVRNATTNIPEPPEGAKEIDETKIDAVLVPGRAFTEKGIRLGRGNGGYDRWIFEQRKRNTATKMFGLCFDSQIVQEIPVEEHDQTVDTVITSSHIY